VEKYEDAEESRIWEYSGRIEEDEEELRLEIENYKKKIESFAESQSAEPERKTGKWIDDGTELGLCCSECQKSMDDYVASSDYIYLNEIPIFCPNCGAKMEVKS